MKKICHVTSAHPRYDVRIFEKECCSLARNGYEVYLLVNDNREDEVKNGVHIVSTGFLPFSRKERMITSMSLLLSKMIQIDADAYHFHDPELLRLVRKVKKIGKKVVFDAHEDTEAQIMDKQWIPMLIRRSVSVLFRLYFQNVIKKCDAVVSVTPKMVEKLGENNKHVFMITNYPVIEQRKTENEIENVKKDEKKYVFFAGGVSEQWCHERIIRAVSKLPGVRYRLAGGGEDSYLELLKKTDGWEKVDYLGKINHSEVVNEYVGAIAGLAINECTQIRGEGTLGNTKLFEIMAAGIPVICTDYRLWKEIIEENDCGICVDSSDEEAICRAISFFMNTPEEISRMGANGIRAVNEKYNWGTQEETLVSLYSELIGTLD